MYVNSEGLPVTVLMPVGVDGMSLLLSKVEGAKGKLQV